MTAPQAPGTPGTGPASVGTPKESVAPNATVTGDRRVDEALSLLDGLPALPLADHVPVYEATHQVLQDALATVDGE